MSNDRKYLILGGGKLATHMGAYLELCGIEPRQWIRRPLADSHHRLREAVAQATHILFAMTDAGTAEIFAQFKDDFRDKALVHFSGVLSLTGVLAAHPLMTFSGPAYALETYRQIPFVSDSPAESVRAYFPFFPNPVYQIASDQRALYHALCVASGNFTVLLWQTVLHEFEQRLGLPPAVLMPYMHQTFTNIEARPHESLTGPIARRDQANIEANLKALEGSPLAEVYASFLRLTK